MISVLVIACDEERRLEQCVRSARPGDEIVIVVQDSRDRTPEIASRCADAVVTDRCHGTSEPSRALGLAACSCAWVLNLDADETLTPWAAARLLWWCRLDAPIDLYRLRRRTVVGGQAIEDACHARLFRRATVVAPADLHSSFHVPGGRELTIDSDVCIDHIKTWDEQNADNARYARLMAR